ncbi:MAG: protein kinase, partial [Myxococcota bacterium]
MNRTVRGNIRIESVIGSGGMGTVYKGFEAHLQRHVAVKVLNTMAGSHQRSVSYFMQEARVLSKLRHPNLVSVIDFGQESDGTLLMVMEYIPGRSLESLLEAERTFQYDRILRILIQVLSALEEVHRHQIIHRDLKPGNIVLEDVAGAQDFVKVLDFGIAKILQTNTFTGIDGTLTAAGTAVGTPHYMSPEQAQGLELDSRSDIYSAGTLMFEMLTGQLPFASENIVGMLVRRMAEDPPIPSIIREDIPPELDAICLKAMAREPNQRYADVVQFREDLLGLLPLLADPNGGNMATAVSRSASPGSLAAREVMVLAIDMEHSDQPEEELETFIQRFAEASGGFYKPPQQGYVAVVIFEHNDRVAGWFQAAEAAVQMQKSAVRRFGSPQLQMGLSHGSIYGHSGSDPLDTSEVAIGPAIAMAMEQAQRAGLGRLLAPQEAAQALTGRLHLESIGEEVSVGPLLGRESSPEPTSFREPLTLDSASETVLERPTATRRLDHAVKRVVQGEPGGPLLLIGPHGAGKSHLVAYAKRLAQGAGLLVLESNATSELTDRPFRPIFDLFIQFLVPPQHEGNTRLHPEELRQSLLRLGLGTIEARLFVDQFVAGTLD